MEESRGKKYAEEVYSERVQAGKRTYFFDIRATKSGDFYITITESKRQPKGLGYYYEKHKIFLYKEDFNKFNAGLNAALQHARDCIRKHTGSYPQDRVDDRVDTAQDASTV